MMKTHLRRLSASLLFAIFAACIGLNSALAIDINTASSIELQELRGVGPKRAEAIIHYREKNGPFKAREDLLKIRGIGQRFLDLNDKDIELSSSLKTSSAVSQ